jgi:hypothetical protein
MTASHTPPTERRRALGRSQLSALVCGVAKFSNGAIDRLGYRARSPDANEILAAAAELAGAGAIDDWAVRVPLHRWCDALREEANLNGVGRITAHWDAVRMLRTLCRLTEEDARAPAARAEVIDQPIFITGLPRSGSTFLHRLLALDPANAAPRCWQSMAPYPPRLGADKRRRQVDRQLGLFNLLAPGLASVHPLLAEGPQECSELMAPTFRSFRFDTTHHVPSYRQWLDGASHSEAYGFHRRFLQHLQHQSGPKRWVLKCPDHIFSLATVDRAYPDARYIFLHRDPLRVLPSVARLTQLLREPFTKSVDPRAIGRQVSRDCRQIARRMMLLRQLRGPTADRIVHLRYDMIRDYPLQAVATIYDRFGIELTPQASAAIKGEITRSPRGGYGHNVYGFETYQLDAGEEREAFRSYTDGFDVPLEVTV